MGILPWMIWVGPAWITSVLLREVWTGTSLVVQWLRLCTSTAGGMGSIPGRGTKIPHATWHGLKKKKERKREKGRDLTHTEEKVMWRQRWNLEGCGHKPRNASSCQNLEDARDRFSSRTFRGCAALLPPWFWTSAIDFRLLAYRTVEEETCVILSHQVCGNLLKQPQEMNTIPVLMDI